MKNIKLALGFSFFLIIILGVSVVKLSRAAIGDGHFVHSCVKNNSGDVRIVDAGVTCNGNETALKWNSDGVDDFGGFVTKNFSNSDFTNYDFRYRDMRGSNFTAAIMSGTDFSFANFKNANLRTASVTSSEGEFSNFSGADFTESSIQGVWPEAKFTNAIFVRASLSLNAGNNDFQGANLTEATFGTSSLNGSNFAGANLTSTSFGNSNLSDVDFTGAIFVDVFAEAGYFTNANFTNVAFVDSNFNAARDMDTANRTGVTWTNTICPDGTNSNDNGNTCEGHFNWM